MCPISVRVGGDLILSIAWSAEVSTTTPSPAVVRWHKTARQRFGEPNKRHPRRTADEASGPIRAQRARYSRDAEVTGRFFDQPKYVL